MFLSSKMVNFLGVTILEMQLGKNLNQKKQKYGIELWISVDLYSPTIRILTSLLIDSSSNTLFLSSSSCLINSNNSENFSTK